MKKEKLIIEIKKRMSAIYIAVEEPVADDLYKIFVEMLKYLESDKSDNE